MAKVLFWIAFFVAYTIQGVTGFAGNIFAMPVGTSLLGLASSVSVLNAMGFFACGLLAIVNIKDVSWRELIKIICIMMPFMFLGIWLDSIVELRVLLRIYGVMIIAVGVYNLIVKRQRFLPVWAQVLIVMAAGLIQGMFVSGGALLVIYAIQALRDKQQFRATLSMVWTVLNFIYAAISFQAGHFTWDVVSVIIGCIPLAVVSTLLGNKIQKRISQEKFLRFTYVLLLLVGVVVFATA